MKADGIKIDDNFFDVGGNSVIVPELKSRVAAEFGRDLFLTDFFRYPTIRQTAARLISAESFSTSGKNADWAMRTAEVRRRRSRMRDGNTP